jgi:hypothetical protein
MQDMTNSTPYFVLQIQFHFKNDTENKHGVLRASRSHQSKNSQSLVSINRVIVVIVLLQFVTVLVARLR